jgi:hypothetical protein
MMEVYIAEHQMKVRSEQLMNVTLHAWKWFGERTFCKRCLEEERTREISAD